MCADITTVSASDITIIKDWLKQQPHLPDDWDEKWIETCLRWSNFSIEKCKRKIDSYFTMKTVAPEFFVDRDVRKLRKVTEHLNIVILPKLIMPQRHRVLLISATKPSYEGLNVINQLKCGFVGADIRLLTGDSGALGEHYVINWNLPYCAHYLQNVTVAQMKKYTVCLQEAFSARIKGFHLLNVSPVFQTIVTLMKPFLKEKLRDRIYIHKNLESLYKHIPKEILPEEFGGDAGTLPSLTNDVFEFMESHQKWLTETEGIKSEETKRPGKARNAEELFGVEGSFRKLTID